jgi:hypothetical protein
VHGKVRSHTPDSIEQLVSQLVEECIFLNPKGAENRLNLTFKAIITVYLQENIKLVVDISPKCMGRSAHIPRIASNN